MPVAEEVCAVEDGLLGEEGYGTIIKCPNTFAADPTTGRIGRTPILCALCIEQGLNNGPLDESFAVCD
jgi:hypothetical protein